MSLPCGVSFFVFVFVWAVVVRCDDLESLGYVILAMLDGGSSRPLPWSGSTSVADGLATKKATSLETLCRGHPSAMLRYMKAVRGMDYEETPDYDALDGMLEAMQKEKVAKTGAARGATRGSSSSDSSTRSASARGGVEAKENHPPAKKGKTTRKPTTEVEVLVKKGKGKGKGASSATTLATAAMAGSVDKSPTLRRGTRRAPRQREANGHDNNDEEKEENGKSLSPTRSMRARRRGRANGGLTSSREPSTKKAVGTTSSKGDESDGDDGYFDAQGGHDDDDDGDNNDDDDVVEVTKVVGRTRQSRGSSAASRAASGIASKKRTTRATATASASAKGSKRKQEYQLEVKCPEERGTVAV